MTGAYYSVHLYDFETRKVEENVRDLELNDAISVVLSHINGLKQLPWQTRCDTKILGETEYNVATDDEDGDLVISTLNFITLDIIVATISYDGP